MIKTPELIDVLATELKPVRRLGSPVFRAVCWSCVAAAVLLLLCISEGLRPDIGMRVGDTHFTVALVASGLTAICAAVAACNLVIPGRSSAWSLLPIPPLLAWIGSIGHQCLTQWVSYDGAGMGMGETARCFATLALISLPLWLLMFLMLRRARPLREVLPMLAGSLAVAAAAATAMDLIHPLDTSAMILLWNFGTGALIVLASALVSRRVLAEPSLA